MTTARRTVGRRGRGPRRIGLFCGYGCGNVGNDASLEVAAQILTSEWPDAEVIIITPFVAGAQARTKMPVVAMNPSMVAASVRDAHKLLKLATFLRYECIEVIRRLRVLNSLDCVVAPGTGLLDDFMESPAGMPYAVLAWTLAAKLMRTPFAMVAIGAGPLANPLSRFQMRLAARLATAISYRDEASRRFMAGAGARAMRHPVVCDLVFADALPGSPPKYPSVACSHPRTIGIGTMRFDGWSGDNSDAFDTYIREISCVVRGLVADGYRVRLVVGQPVDDAAAHAVLATLTKVERDYVTFQPVREFVDLLKEVQQSDVVVATRYHHLVAALMMRRPVISVSYAHKNQALLERLDMSRRECSIHEVDADWLLHRIREICSTSVEFSTSQHSLIDEWRALARDAILRGAPLRA